MKRPSVDPDALLCALVLVPGSFSRNRFFGMYEDEELRKVRRRAGRVRGIIRQLVGTGRVKAEVTGEQVLDDGRVLVRFEVENLSFIRTTALSRIEAAAMRYALHRAGKGKLSAEDRDLVESALSRLGRELGMQLGADDGDSGA